MGRYLGLYIIALVGLVVGANVSGLSFLTPLSLAVLLFGAIGLWRLEKESFRDLGFPKNARWLRQLVLSTLAGIGMVLLFIALALLTRSATIEAKQELTDSLPPLIFQTFLYTALIAASEEITFRGVYFQVLRRRYTVLIGAIVSAILWAIFHLPAMAADGALLYQMVLGLLTFTAFGATLAFASALAGSSLWVPIGIHYGYNLAFSSLGAFFAAEISGPSYLTGASGWYPETGIIGVAVWTIAAVILYTRLEKKAPAVGSA